MSEADDLIAVNLWLAGRSYRIRISASDEARVRKAAHIADERIKELRLHYAGKDDQDFVAMCLLTYATENLPAAETIDNTLAEEMIRKIDSALED